MNSAKPNETVISSFRETSRLYLYEKKTDKNFTLYSLLVFLKEKEEQNTIEYSVLIVVLDRIS